MVAIQVIKGSKGNILFHSNIISYKNQQILAMLPIKYIR
jgi:hypothetical protein